MKINVFVLSAFLSPAFVFAQKRMISFSIVPDKTIVSESKYNSIEFLDARQDSNSMGFVQKGILNNFHTVVPDPSIAQQVQEVFNRLIDSSAGNQQLVLQCRHMSFAEVAKPLREKGYFYCRLILWVKSGEKYKLLDRIDTSVVVFGDEISFRLFNEASKLVTGFIKANLAIATDPESQSFSLLEVKNIDLLEKRKLPLYTTGSYKDGLYTTYQSFKNQVPDGEALVEMDDKQIHRVKYYDAKGKLQELDSKKVYAVVREGIPYVANKYGYYELKKIKSDFYFIGTNKTSYDADESFNLWFQFGLVGLMAAKEKIGSWQFKIDHLNGSFIPIKQLHMDPEGRKNNLLY